MNQKQSVPQDSGHIRDSIINLQQTLTVLKGYLAKAEYLKKFDDQVFKQKMDIAQNETDFLLCCALKLTVMPEMRKKMPRYTRWCAHPDPEFNRLREELAALMTDYYRLRDGIEEGKGSAAAQEELSELEKRAQQVIPAIHA